VPELPEVETVRAGLARWVTRRTVAAVEVRHPRAIRRHVAGAADFAERLAGTRIEAVSRRGKYLWFPLAAAGRRPEECLVGHLGMSGQLLVRPADAPEEKHLHVRMRFAESDLELRFVDQRTFGGFLLDELVPTADRPEQRVPARIAHIARDPLDPHFDDPAWARRLRSRRSAVKRALLDQTLISGVGNIYADESLWRARLHGERSAAGLTRTAVLQLLAQVREVLRDALRAGGTSFDALYVNVDGESGYFERSLAVYGREGLPCPRCGSAVRRAVFMNRSSFFCPACQRPPRIRRPDAAESGDTMMNRARPQVDRPLPQ
jgi:formamidopyrimidine-DNA glycosylase